MKISRFLPFVLAVFPVHAIAAPLQYLSSSGPKSDLIVALTRGVLVVSIVVVIVIAILLAGAIWHRPGAAMRAGDRTALVAAPPALSWLWIGVGVSTVVLLFIVVWTMQVLASIAAPPQKPALTIEITGRQWWWQVRYLSDDPAQSFVTANEIHIPSGVPVRFHLISGDVIHSFWVPQLSGKTDLIPGQTNELWLQANAPGTYSGQCTEYCGLQHAHMALSVIAESPSDFVVWRAHQLEAPNPQLAATPGAMDFAVHCGSCHSVRGTGAAGLQGPDLSHLMERHGIASDSLPNDGSHLVHWIADPQSLKPGSLMPAPTLSGQELNDIHTYLSQLQ